MMMIMVVVIVPYLNNVPCKLKEEGNEEDGVGGKWGASM